MRAVSKDKILLHRKQPQGSSLAVWRARRTAGRRAGGGGRRRGAGARAAATPEVPARPPARLGRPRRRPRGRADRLPRCPAGELSRGMQRGHRPRLCSRSSLLGRRLLPSSPPLLCPSLPRPLFFPSPSTVFPLVLSFLSFPLLLPSSCPGRPCKVAPESPGSRVGRQPPAAAAGFLGCFLPGWDNPTTFALFWEQSLGF